MADNNDEVSEEITADVTETEEEGPSTSAEFSIEGIYNDKSNEHYIGVYIDSITIYKRSSKPAWTKTWRLSAIQVYLQ